MGPGFDSIHCTLRRSRQHLLRDTLTPRFLTSLRSMARTRRNLPCFLVFTSKFGILSCSSMAFMHGHGLLEDICCQNWAMAQNTRWEHPALRIHCFWNILWGCFTDSPIDSFCLYSVFPFVPPDASFASVQHVCSGGETWVQQDDSHHLRHRYS